MFQRNCFAAILVCVLAASAFAQAEPKPSPPVSDVALDRYFQQYCDAVVKGSGRAPGGATDYGIEFHERLKGTQDEELKRLFVLQHLYSDVERRLRNYQQRIVWTGKNMRREMTEEERVAARSRLVEMLDDLSRFERKDPVGEIKLFRERLKAADEVSSATSAQEK